MIAIASDHGGYDLKERVKKYLEEKNIPYQDMGCDSKASCDYPVFGHAAARAVADGTCRRYRNPGYVCGAGQTGFAET